MNKENILDTHLKRFKQSQVENRKKSFLSQMKYKLNIEKSDNRRSKLTEDKNYIIKEKKEENKEIINDNNDDNEPKKIILQIPQEIKKKKHKKKKLDLANKKLIRNRRLNRAKNLYDSNDDDESGIEEDQYIIDPETKIIVIFDFLLLTCFLYYFIFTTFSLSREKCFCPVNKGIKISDFFTFD